jgi:hypothetical protein
MTDIDDTSLESMRGAHRYISTPLRSTPSSRTRKRLHSVKPKHARHGMTAAG